VKTCFFISPIGSPESAERAASNKLLRFIIEPVLEKCGYEKPVRADHITQPGVVTSQIFTKLWNDDLVIADLTGSNPNVFYELAVRHIRRRPCVHLIHKDARLPFDVAPNRTIFFDFDIEEANKAQDELEAMILAVEKDQAALLTPLSLAIDLAPLDKSKNPVEIGISEILALAQDIRAIVGQLDVGGPPGFQAVEPDRSAVTGKAVIETLEDSVRLLPFSTSLANKGKPLSRSASKRNRAGQAHQR
jgi:hypothetical protein